MKVVGIESEEKYSQLIFEGSLKSKKFAVRNFHLSSLGKYRNVEKQATFSKLCLENTVRKVNSEKFPEI